LRVHEHYSGASGKKYDELVLEPIEEGGKVQARFFKDFINSDDIVLDFGCGRGEILANINCSEKHGLEINEHSRQIAATKFSIVYAKFEEVPDNFFDKIISNHVLEHTKNPLYVLQNLRKKLKNGGEIILVLPLDDWRSKKQKYYHKDDIDQHLFAWTPLSIGNLFGLAGFKEIKIKIISKAWSPKMFFLMKISRLVFELSQTMFSILKKRRQLLIVAKK